MAYGASAYGVSAYGAGAAAPAVDPNATPLTTTSAVGSINPSTSAGPDITTSAVGSISPSTSATPITTTSAVAETAAEALPSLNGSGSNDVAFTDELETNVKFGSASNTVSFGDGATSNVQFHATDNDILFDVAEPVTNLKFIPADTDILFGDVLVAGKEQQLSAFNDVTFGATPTSNVQFPVALNDILFDTANVVAKEKQESISNDILFDDVGTSNVFPESLVDSIGFSLDLGIQRPGTGSNDFGFQQLLFHNIIFKDVENSITFDDELGTQLTALISLADTIIFNQVMGPTIEDTADNSVLFDAEAFRAGDPSNDVLFDHVGVGDKSKGQANSFGFSQTVTVVRDPAALAVSNDVVFTSDLVEYFDG